MAHERQQKHLLQFVTREVTFHYPPRIRVREE